MGILKLDQVNFLQQLLGKWPALLEANGKGILIIKPKYRERILELGTSVQQIMDSEYGPMDREEDRVWARKHVEEHFSRDCGRGLYAYTNPEEKDLKRFPEVGYSQIGFRTNQTGKLWVGDSDQHQVCYKLYFELKSHIADLSPDKYSGFVCRLRDEGFNGGSKIQLSPGKARFGFNNIVLHASTEADALLGERIGLEYFEETLASTGRGLDVKFGPGPQESLDWNAYLCKFQSTNRLPETAKRFVAYVEC